MGDLEYQKICKNLIEFYNDTEDSVKAEALVRRAYIDKTSSDTISQKVNAQLNSIKSEIYNINPKFKETSKNYNIVKQSVSEVIAEYEQILIDVSEFYDNKIEQLILKKVELEAGLTGALLNEEYLNQKLENTNNQKENDKLKKSVKQNIKNVFEKFKNKKTSKSVVDSKMITTMLDQQDIVSEVEMQLDNRIEKSQSAQKENKNFIVNNENEIAFIETEIKRINDLKVKTLFEAMEIGDKSITINVRKPRVFSKITKFFVSRFNTVKAIENGILKPLRFRIDEFKSNELVSMKG